jgi:hypothetical protein
MQLRNVPGAARGHKHLFNGCLWHTFMNRANTQDLI